MSIAFLLARHICCNTGKQIIAENRMLRFCLIKDAKIGSYTEKYSFFGASW